MSANKLFTLLAVMTLTLTTTAQERTIEISNSLKDRADILPVKMGVISMGVYKFKFGNYSVSESKMGWNVATQKGKMFNRKTESSSKQKFFFELNGPTDDVAHVNVVNTIETEALREWVLFSYTTDNFQFRIDEEAELLLEANSFSAVMTINSDTTDIWSLIMTTFKGSKVDEQYKSIALLTNGLRKIQLVPITSNEDGNDKRKIPGYGYELREDGQGLAALQFYGGGAWGANKNIIWLSRDVEPKMKLLLAATLTAVLQNKVGQMTF